MAFLSTKVFEKLACIKVVVHLREQLTVQWRSSVKAPAMNGNGRAVLFGLFFLSSLFAAAGQLSKCG
jgi:hypothetical protein